MNSLDFVWNNKKFAESLRTQLFDYIKSQTKSEIQPGEPRFYETEVPYEIHATTAVRLNIKRDTLAVFLGSPQAEFYKSFYELLSPAGSTPADPKTIETELSKIMLNVLTPEFKASQIVLDPKASYNLPLKALGSWTKVTTQKSLRLPFRSPKGEHILEIPFFNAAYHSEKIVEHFGFSQEARILIVDDSATTRKLSRHYLACAGFQNVEECVDGSAALTKVTSSRPPFDLVIADWHMPIMTGIEMLKKIRATKELKSLPVILVTGERNKEEVGNAVREGVSGYVVKPFDSDALYKAMKKAHAVGAAIAAKNAAAAGSAKKAA